MAFPSEAKIGEDIVVSDRIYNVPPKGLRCALFIIKISNVTTPQILHHLTDTIFFAGRAQQMNMVGHHHPCMHINV